MTNPFQHEFVRDNDGVVEHCVFTSDLRGNVLVSLEVMSEMLMALGFRPVDTIGGDVVASEDAQTVPTTENAAH